MTEDEFEAFFRLVHPKLVRFAMRRFDAATAEDLASRALHTFWERRPKVPAGGVSSAQLQHLAYAILIGLMRNEQRAQQARQRAMTRLAHERTARHSPDPADLVVGPTWPDWAEDLSLSNRDVLELVAENYSADEIAIILGETVAAVHQRISRARRKVLLLMRRGVRVDD